MLYIHKTKYRIYLVIESLGQGSAIDKSQATISKKRKYNSTRLDFSTNSQRKSVTFLSYNTKIE